VAKQQICRVKRRHFRFGRTPQKTEFL
jgi:hypothetical protein